IQGAGPIGLFTALIAQISGAHHVIINDMSEERLDLANELGVQYPIRADSQKSLAHAISTITENQGVDVSFDCAGVQPTLTGAIQALKNGGKVTVIALFQHPPVVDV
ncbi:zinc-binding dehydrogenase, partial [Oenococcus oeni]